MKIQVLMSRNVHFYYIKSTFFDIVTYIFKSYDCRKTNNISFECPGRWVQNTKRTDLQLFQGLSRNLSFKKCIFYKKDCVTVSELHNCLWHIMKPTTRASKWRIICYLALVVLIQIHSTAKMRKLCTQNYETEFILFLGQFRTNPTTFLYCLDAYFD